MDSTRLEAIARAVTTSMARRTALHGLFASAATAVVGGALQPDGASAKRRKSKNKNKKNRKKGTKQQTKSCECPTSPPTSPPPPPPPPPPQPEPNPCAEKNWCVDRSQICGPASGYGKCLVEATGGNICAEILYQVATCDDCAAPNCTNCRCVLAAGGGDRCNNGATGYDFICVRPI